MDIQMPVMDGRKAAEAIRRLEDPVLLIMSVIEGKGTVNGQAVRKGDHFILPDGFGEVVMEGNMQVIASTI